MVLSMVLCAGAPIMALNGKSQFNLNVESGDNATYTWKGRKASTTYEWFVEVVDADGVKNVSSVWNFTTTS
jgi:hypothetical protein